MCARFSVGSILFLHFLRSIATPLSTGVMACLERSDPAGICAPKSVFLLLANSSAEDGLTQLSLCLGSQDWPVNCTIHEIGQQDDQMFIVMELLEGSSLQNRIAGKPLPLEQLLEWAIQICDAL